MLLWQLVEWGPPEADALCGGQQWGRLFSAGRNSGARLQAPLSWGPAGEALPQEQPLLLQPQA